MKQFILIFLTVGVIHSYGQSSKFDSLNSVYKDPYLFKKFHNYKKDKGFLNGMITEISGIEDKSTQQYALIALYNQSYGFQWVSKNKLSDLIDSVILHSLSDEIKIKARDIKDEREKGLIGFKIPPINLKDANHTYISINSINSDFIVLDLWATWCKPCLADMKKIPALKEKYGNVEFYSISFDQNYKKMVKFLNKKDYKWPIVFAGQDHELWKLFQVRALPQYYILNKDRIIIKALSSNLEDTLKDLASNE